MAHTGAPIPLPENWDALTDAEKEAVTEQLLIGIADAAGVRRGSSGGGADQHRPRRRTRFNR